MRKWALLISSLINTTKVSMSKAPEALTAPQPLFGSRTTTPTKQEGSNAENRFPQEDEKSYFPFLMLALNFSMTLSCLNAFSCRDIIGC